MGEFPEIPARNFTWLPLLFMLISCCPLVSHEYQVLLTTWKVQIFQIIPDPNGKTLIFTLISFAMFLLCFVWLSR